MGAVPDSSSSRPVATTVDTRPARTRFAAPLRAAPLWQAQRRRREEQQALTALADLHGLDLDPLQVAARADLPPSRAASAIDSLVRYGLVERIDVAGKVRYRRVT